MAPGDFVDMESSAEIPFTLSPNSIPDDIFQAALAASEHDSDGEDPYGPQPKRFMQTEHQKEEQKRALEIRKVAWTLRKMRKNRQRSMKQKQRPCPFQKLPPELVLKLMQHTRWEDLVDFRDSSATNRSIFKTNLKAILRGIEIEQFPEWRWLFGDSKRRTPAQSQHLKDAIFSENQFPATLRLVRGERPFKTLRMIDNEFTEMRDVIFLQDMQNRIGVDIKATESYTKILRMIDNNEFTGMRNVIFLQDMQNRIDVDIKATESYTKMKISRRTAICLRSLTSQQPRIVNKNDGTEYQLIVLPWEARSQLINEQPASTKAEIRSIVKIVIEDFYRRLEQLVLEWERRHYRNPDNRGRPQELKKWMSKLVTGLILETVIPAWRAMAIGGLPTLLFVCLYHRFISALTWDLRELLDEHDRGTVDVIEKVREGVEFGKSVGLDLETLLEGTMAGDFLAFSE